MLAYANIIFDSAMKSIFSTEKISQKMHIMYEKTWV